MDSREDATNFPIDKCRLYINTNLWLKEDTDMSPRLAMTASYLLFVKIMVLTRDVAPFKKNREGKDAINFFLYDLSRNIIENKGRVKGTSHDVHENKRG